MSFNDYIYWQTVYETGKTPEEIYEYEHPEVVRCKECIWRDKDNKGENYCTYAKGLADINDGSFCSWGEREGE